MAAPLLFWLLVCLPVQPAEKVHPIARRDGRCVIGQSVVGETFMNVKMPNNNIIIHPRGQQRQSRVTSVCVERIYSSVSLSEVFETSVCLFLYEL